MLNGSEATSRIRRNSIYTFKICNTLISVLSLLHGFAKQDELMGTYSSGMKHCFPIDSPVTQRSKGLTKFMPALL